MNPNNFMEECVKSIALEEYNKKIQVITAPLESFQKGCKKGTLNVAYWNGKNIIIADKLPKEFATPKKIWGFFLHELAHIKGVKEAPAFIEVDGVFRETTESEKLHSGEFQKELRRLKRKYSFSFFLDKFMQEEKNA